MSDGKQCWICLEGSDDTTELFRECACRGDAGFVHDNCLVSWHRSRQPPQDYELWFKQWITCPHCRQEIRGQLLLIVLSNCQEHISGFMDDPFDQSRFLLMVQCVKLESISNEYHYSSNDPMCKEVVSESLSMLKNFNRNRQPDGTLAPIVLRVYGEIGAVYMGCHDLDEQSARLGCNFLHRAWDGFQLLDLHEDDEEWDACRNLEKQLIGVHEMCVKKFGHSDLWVFDVDIDRTIQYEYARFEAAPANSGDRFIFGLNAAAFMRKNGRCVDAWRLLSSLYDDCQRVMGDDHLVTQSMNQMLQDITRPLVTIKKKGLTYKVKGYRGNDAILTGPILNRDGSEGPVELIASIEDIVPYDLPAPVMVINFTGKANKHLNGLYGDARSFDENAKRYVVHFEDSKLQPKKLPMRNISLQLNPET